MKKLFIILLVIAFSNALQAQKVITGTSQSGYVNITKDPPKPPFLEIIEGSLQFIDSDGNQMIDANEQTKIRFEIKNSGNGPGLNIKAITTETNYINGLSFSQSTSIVSIEPNTTKTVDIPISANMNTINSKAIFSIEIEEANGFGIDPFTIEIPTRAFVNPLIQIVDYKVTSQSGTTIQKKRPFEVQVLVQNIGQGIASNIQISLPVPENMFCLSDNAISSIGMLKAGESKLIEYSLIANNNYVFNTISLNFDLSENYGKYAEDKEITLTMNQQVSDTKLVVQGIETTSGKEIEIGSLTSVVDKNIPFNPVKNPKRLALIIGNENYTTSLNAEINVDYARNDADIFRKYAVNCMGVEENNVFFLTDATAGTMKTKIELVSKLLSKLGNESELIFYYAGHGYPDESAKIPYLIPVDVNATNLDAAIKLSDIYSQFANSGSKRITVFLDACFTGGGRNQGLLAARAVKVKPKEEMIAGNMVVFTASSGKQSALPYHREKHGMFTYFLLKKLQDSKGYVTYEELGNYIKQNVSIESLRVNGKEQDPNVNISPAIESVWKSWSFK